MVRAAALAALAAMGLGCVPGCSHARTLTETSAPAPRADVGAFADASGALDPARASAQGGAEGDASSGAAPSPFGSPVPIERYTCPIVQRGGPYRAYIAGADTRVAFVDGDDLLALVNRSPTGALSPDYAPTDLVDLRDGLPHTSRQCEAGRECLRADAARHLKDMLARMRDDHVEGHVQSTYRAFSTQCWVFASWAQKARGGFCEAAEQSALPGHSQHQLGTTLDLFTREWAEEGARTGAGVFRNGFGCSPGGAWIQEHAWEFGFVISYPSHPDDRRADDPCRTNDARAFINPKTGYQSEPWHLRFIGVEAASQYRDALKASGLGTSDEITLEQWLRAQRGLVGDAELPVCDGCECGACETLAGGEALTPCGRSTLWLDPSGRVFSPADGPRLLGAWVSDASHDSDLSADELRVMVRVEAPAHTPTQTPVADDRGPDLSTDSSYLSTSPRPGAPPHHYPDLPGAWRLGIETDPPHGSTPFPWRVSLAAPELGATWNRANLLLPAKPGETTLRVRVAPVGRVKHLRVALLREGTPSEVREIPVGSDASSGSP